MKKFLVLYRMDMDAMRKMMETMSKEDQQKGMEEWGKWMQENKSAFADMGGPAGKNWQVTPSGASQMSNDVGGYSVLQAESEEAAAKMLADSPHFHMPGATMDVMEIKQM